MNKHLPRVSIGLPVFNGEKYLAAAIDSILSQTFEDFECVISDNHSSDRTVEICRAYAERDSRIHYYRAEQNHGMAWNWNRTVELARGEYFKWICHDDVCAPTWLERCVEVLDREPEVAWCHSKCSYMDEVGKPISGPNGLAEVGFLPASGSVASRGADRPHNRFHAVLSTSDVGDIFGLIRTEMLHNTRLYPPYYGGDQVLIAELSLMGRYAEVPEALCLVRRHAKQSQWLPTQRKQHELMTGRPAPWLFFPRQLRCTIGRMDRIRTAPISWPERVRCYRAMISVFLQAKKWKRLGVDVLRAAGLRVPVPEDAIDPRLNPETGTAHPVDL